MGQTGVARFAVAAMQGQVIVVDVSMKLAS
jgi:hypothetical protein